ncbi:MAG: RNA methyltransferase [Candidatus Altiarchaeota archaeon]
MKNLYIVLVEPKYEGNIGSVARVMKNFGFEKLVLVNPPQIGRDARKMSMHGLNILMDAKTYPSFNEMKKDFDFLVATTAKAGGDSNFHRKPIPLDKLNPRTSGKIAILFGREDYGLLTKELRACDLQVFIPANPEYSTLNLSQSVGIFCYELSKKEMAGKIKAKKFKAAGPVERKVLQDKFEQIVDSVYDHNYENQLIKKTFRHVLGRSFVSGKEVYNLIGLFRRIGTRI